MPEVSAFALKTLDRVLAAALIVKASGKSSAVELSHVVAYGEADGHAERVAGVLDDYVFLGHALLDAWEATGKFKYYEDALAITTVLLTRFYDATGSGFFDTELAAPGEHRLGALAARRKPLQDSPTPAGNPMAASLLVRMDALNDRPGYSANAQATLETFAGVVEHFGLYAATYALALQRMSREPVQVCVVGEDELAHQLERAALERFDLSKSVVRLKAVQLGKLPPVLLPPNLQRTLPNLPTAKGSFAVVCAGKTCHLPVSTVDDLVELLGRSQ
jgi:uncharacterized protein YyaL (SSP411 family)